jgi:hypothetical protein
MYMLSLVLLLIYYYLNVRLIGAGVGYIFLFLFLFSTLFFQIRNPFLIFYTIKRNILFVIIFLTYLCLRQILDSQSFSGIFSFMFGTTSGVFFSFGLGVAVSYVFCNIYNTLLALPGSIYYFRKFVFIYFIFCLFFSLDLLQHYLSIKVTSAFSIAETPVDYQRPGMLIFLFNIQNAILFAIHRSFLNYKRHYIGIFFYTICISSALLAQLIGSNFSFVGVLLLSGVMLIYGRLINVSRNSYYKKKLSLGSFFYGWIGKEILVVGLITLLLGMLILFALNSLSLFDLRNLRIFGDNWEVDSITERFRLINLLFVEHFNFAPVFGNMIVHKSMETQYIHSLLSLFTHLGITGFILFFIVFYVIYKDIERCGKYNNNVNFEYQLLRLLMISFILFLAALSNFITWMPLWFIVGLFAVSFINPEYPISSLKNILRK